MLTANEAIRIHQQQLLDAIDAFFARRGKVMTESIRDAFLVIPRHLFVDRYKTFPASDWHEVKRYDLARHLAVLYRDEGLGIFDDGHRVATISRPALVLYMLQMLKLDRGLRVFEVGTGSGWNAALIGALVGHDGYVESVEIIPELAARAQQSIARAGLSNVHIRCADGSDNSDNSDEQQVFDRVVFTTSAHDIPAAIHARVREGGLLLMVLKCPGGGDLIILFRRQSNILLALESRLCEFVPMTGQGQRQEHEPVPVEEVLNSTDLRDKLIFVIPFSCGGRHADDFAERTFPIRSFLAATEPNFIPLVDPHSGTAFAVQSASRDWLVMVRNGEALCYGKSAGWDHLMRLMHGWVDLGMPTMLSMDLCAYLSGQAPTPLADRQWLMKRRDTDFIWSI